MKAEILTIGDELLIGQVINTNAAWLGEQLHLIGVHVERMLSLGDDAEAIRRALEEAYQPGQIAILTGGLGPTHDDVTLNVVADYFDAELQFNEAVFKRVQERFRYRGIKMADSIRSQALVPEGFEALPNPVGTAPGFWRTEGEGEQRRILVVLPGVPYEMKTLMQEAVLPRLQALGGFGVIRHRTLLTTGIGESNLAVELGDLSAFLGSHLRLAYLPSIHGVRLRLTGVGEDQAAVEGRVKALETHIRERAGAYIFGTGQELLEEVVGRMLAEQGHTVATAESCTGGFIAHRLTNVSGSSGYVIGGVVAYSNTVKTEVLGVAPQVLEAYGAVSEIVARQMAQGVRKRLGADIGLATTGVMGPTGGTPNKPVGTVWIGYADEDSERAVLHRFGDGRIRNKERTSTAALNLVRQVLMQQHEEA